MTASVVPELRNRHCRGECIRRAGYHVGSPGWCRVSVPIASTKDLATSMIKVRPIVIALDKTAGQELWRHDIRASGFSTLALVEADGRNELVAAGGRDELVGGFDQGRVGGLKLNGRGDD